MSALKTKRLAVVSLLSALAILMSLLKLEVPYPPLPYLRFDLAEIPSAVALLLCDLRAGLLVATVHFAALMMRGEFAPIGPLMKYAAVVSTIVGYAAPARARKWVRLAASASLRTLCMALANYLVLAAVAPELLSVASAALRSVVPLPRGGDLAWVLAFTSVYNALHALLTVSVADLVVKRLRRGTSEPPRASAASREPPSTSPPPSPAPSAP